VGKKSQIHFYVLYYINRLLQFKKKKKKKPEQDSLQTGQVYLNYSIIKVVYLCL
jgi:hypothetical protein